ncbi:hypothetical protein JHN52_34570, partial [Streptomyces sp. MBT97]|nr:hypothetical protein [Streptomyces sp. MBT97]
MTVGVLDADRSGSGDLTGAAADAVLLARGEGFGPAAGDFDAEADADGVGEEEGDGEVPRAA